MDTLLHAVITLTRSITHKATSDRRNSLFEEISNFKRTKEIAQGLMADGFGGDVYPVHHDTVSKKVRSSVDFF